MNAVVPLLRGMNLFGVVMTPSRLLVALLFGLLSQTLLAADPVDLDGVTETHNGDDDYGDQRMEDMLRRCFDHNPRKLVDACIADLAAFRGHSIATDDVTLMAVRRSC